MDINNLDGFTLVVIYEVSDYANTVVYEGKLACAPDDMLEKVNAGTLLLKKKPEYVSNGIINVPKILIEYRGYKIQPKLDFGGQSYQGAGYIHSKGYVVSDGCCNVLPGGTWSHDVVGAKVMIDSLIESKETGKKFWDILREKQGLMEWSEV